MARFGDTNIILSGGVADIWQNTKNGKLVVADYKSQANTKSLEPESYLSDPYKEGYKIQMDFYAYLLVMMGFNVSPTSYFYVCDADRHADAFTGTMIFAETLVPYQWQSGWIEKELQAMIQVLHSDDLPESTEACENCAYARQRSLLERR